jgi:hypothetical protein
MHYWVTGGQCPRTEMRRRIEIWSSGAIPADSWSSAAEDRAAASVQPFTAPDESAGKVEGG